jgi:hypothetical protein
MLIIYLEVNNMNRVHIVVQNGLVQAVYADHGLDIDVVILDMDTDNEEESAEICEIIAQLPAFAKMVY